MADLTRSISRVIIAEDGFVDDPDDPGGATKWGITQRDLDAWRINNPEFPANVADLTSDQAAQIYAASPQWVNPAWSAVGSQWLSDFLVNWGVLRQASNAIRAFQASEGITVDGIWGSETKQRALLFVDDESGNVKFEALAQIISVIVGRPASIKFAAGWLNRIRNI